MLTPNKFVSGKNTETLARKGAQETHISTVNRSSSAKCKLAMEACAKVHLELKTRELSVVPESLYLPLSMYAFHVAAVRTCPDKHWKV